jgi:cytohesin
MVRTKNWDDELLKAAENGNLIKVQTALENGANPNAKNNNNGSTPLHIAAYKGHVEIVKILLDRGADLNAKDNTGHAPLHWAAIEGHVDVVRVLLDRGANPNAKNNTGHTPLHNAAYFGHVEIVKILLDRGADLNAKDNTGHAPLHWAAIEGHVDVVRVLLDRGANPNAKNNTGHTPLHNAAYFGHVEIVKLLLERGADPRIADNGGHIPLDYAKDSAIRIYILSNMQYPRLISKTSAYALAYALVELAYRAVLYSDNYEEALSLIKKINTVDTKDVVSSLEDKINRNLGTKEDILKKIELLRNQIVYPNNIY